jgi:hypothetical protein
VSFLVVPGTSFLLRPPAPLKIKGCGRFGCSPFSFVEKTGGDPNHRSIGVDLAVFTSGFEEFIEANSSSPDISKLELQTH